MDPWIKLREQFPVTRERVFLNHAAVSPLPLACQARMSEYLDEHTMQGPPRGMGTVGARLRTVRELGSKMLGGDVS
ncbi:MAG: hypothetical protein ACOCVR_03655, partial [Myxococcota bacterium]